MFLVRARAKYFISDCFFHIVVAAYRIDFGFFARGARSTASIAQSTPWLHNWAQRHAQTDAAQSIGKCERTFGSVSKVSNLHITCEVHVEAGRQRKLFQLKRADSMCVKLIHTSLASMFRAGMVKSEDRRMEIGAMHWERYETNRTLELHLTNCLQ